MIPNLLSQSNMKNQDMVMPLVSSSIQPTKLIIVTNILLFSIFEIAFKRTDIDLTYQEFVKAPISTRRMKSYQI